jgi:hypothetical protein
MPRSRSCGSYGPGHLMHWIQLKKSHEDGQPIIKVKVVAVHEDGRVEIEGNDLKLTLWYHDPDHLRSAPRFDSYAEWKPKYHVLHVSSSGSFNLATLDQVEPCKPPIRRRPTETTSRAEPDRRGPHRRIGGHDAVCDGGDGLGTFGRVKSHNARGSQRQRGGVVLAPTSTHIHRRRNA